MYKLMAGRFWLSKIWGQALLVDTYLDNTRNAQILATFHAYFRNTATNYCSTMKRGWQQALCFQLTTWIFSPPQEAETLLC